MMTLVFAGTSDARKYVCELAKAGDKVVVCTATKYGASLVPEHDNIVLVQGKPLDKAGIIDMVRKYGIEKIIDATHPYATEISANLAEVSRETAVPLERLHRDSYFTSGADVDFVTDYREAAEKLVDTEGNILLTIGSRRLDAFAEMIDLKRLIIRVLPTSSVLQKCEDLGFVPKQIIAAQGPFSQSFNSSIYDDYDIKYMVTKDSGKVGGVAEKVVPALERDIRVIVISRPEGER